MRCILLQKLNEFCTFLLWNFVIDDFIWNCIVKFIINEWNDVTKQLMNLWEKSSMTKRKRQNLCYIDRLWCLNCEKLNQVMKVDSWINKSISKEFGWSLESVYLINGSVLMEEPGIIGAFIKYALEFNNARMNSTGCESRQLR